MNGVLGGVGSPLVSVVINAQNSEAFIGQSVESLQSQTFCNWEAIVWDNSPTDNTRKLIEAFGDDRLRYFHASAKVPLYLSRVNAIAQAKGDYVAFLDADDLWMSDKLEVQVGEFSSAHVVMSCTDYLMTRPLKDANLSLTGAKKIRTYKKNQTSISGLLLDYRVGMSTLMIRTDVLRKFIEPEPPPYSHLEDLDMVSRCMLAGSLAPVNRFLTIYRRHGANHSRQYTGQKQEWDHWLRNMGNLGLSLSEQRAIESFASNYMRFIEALDLLAKNQKIEAVQLWRKMPFSFRKLKLIIATLIPGAVLRRLLP